MAKREVNPCEACGSRDWIRPSLWVQLRAWLRNGGPWGAGPRTCRRCGERVELGGGYGTRRLTPPRSIPLRSLLAPVWLALALRRNRTAVPVPLTYLVVGCAGAVLGVVAQLVFGFPWWVLAMGVLLAVWLAFLTSARHNLRNVGRTFLQMTTPGLAARASERAFEDAFRDPPFPLYGLPTGWSGRRFLGGHGSDGRAVTSLTLAHGDPFDEDGIDLRVESSVREHDTIEGRRREAFEALLHAARRPPAGLSPDDFVVWLNRLDREIWSAPDPDWRRLDISVDGRPVPFDVVAEGRHWVAVGRIEGVSVVLDCRAMSFSDLALVRITDTAPYVAGSRAIAAQRRAEREH